jgi:hypothetical protein
VAGLVAGAGALAVVLRSQHGAQDGGERVIVVDSHTVPASPIDDAGTAAASLAADPAANGATVASGATAVRAPAVGSHAGEGAAAPRPGSAEALSRVLSGRQDQIAACFSKQAVDISGAPALSVHFETDTGGHVLAAHVLPPSLAGTPLGRCIETVARATEFGPQPKPLSFRIPMTARRSP